MTKTDGRYSSATVEGILLSNPDGLVAATGEMIPEATWQRCYVHFVRERARSLAEEARRRLSPGTALALRPTQSHGSKDRSLRVACQMVSPLSAAANRYINMDDLREHKNLELRKAA